MPAPTLGPVHLTVSDLETSTRWWTALAGLQVLSETGGAGILGAGDAPLVVLHEVPGAPSARGHTGLFHVALLVPERGDLGRWLTDTAGVRRHLTGASDHLVSEALYLRDPDGHGLEIYRDRPREEWPRQGADIRMASDPLDLDDLARAATPGDSGLPPGTRVGHVHLCVADIAPAHAFYQEVLGLDPTARIGDVATFLSWEGYHHHVGANVWESRGASPPPPGSAALRRVALAYPDAGGRDEVVARAEGAGAPVEREDDVVLVRDPSGNAFALIA
jgi:catechol 2,3-dioxygenase